MLVAGPRPWSRPRLLTGADRMQMTASSHSGEVRRLYELMLRVNSSSDLSEVLDEIARGVVEVLGYGVAAIAQLEGDTFVMTTVAGPEEVRAQVLGHRT